MIGRLSWGFWMNGRPVKWLCHVLLCDNWSQVFVKASNCLGVRGVHQVCYPIGEARIKMMMGERDGVPCVQGG